MVVSLPMAAKIQGVSINELDIEEIRLKIKPEYNGKQFGGDFATELLALVGKFKDMVPNDD